jgi:hypothetical protein
VYGLTHRALEKKGNRADTVNLQGSTLTTEAKLALGCGKATAGAEGRSEELDGVAALRAEPAADFAAANATWREKQIEEGSLNTKDKGCACRCQIFLSCPLPTT